MRVKWDNVLCPEHESRSVWLFVTPWNSPCNSPGQNTGVGSHSLLQRIFPTQRSNAGFPHCRWILYQLNHQESPRILEWVANPFPSRSSRPRNQTGISCIAGGFFTSWATREAQVSAFTDSKVSYSSSICFPPSKSLVLSSPYLPYLSPHPPLLSWGIQYAMCNWKLELSV